MARPKLPIGIDVDLNQVLSCFRRERLRVGVLLLCLSLGGCDGRSPFSESANAQALVSADRGALLAALDGIARWHARKGSGLSLNPPLSEQEVKDLDGRFGCQVPWELVEMWRWRDGESTDRFIWYHGFLGAREALTMREELRGSWLISWDESWIPVFSFQEEWYFVPCSDDRRGAAGAPVGFLLLEDGAAVHAYTNLTRFMQTALAGLQEGAVDWDDDWWVERGLPRLKKIHERLNPGLRFPYAVGP